LDWKRVLIMREEDDSVRILLDAHKREREKTDAKLIVLYTPVFYNLT